MGQGRDRAKALAAKAARRKAVVAEKKQAERSVQSLAGRVAVAASSPVERSIRTAALFEVGIGHVILAKRLPTNAIGCAFFLVDVYCLGVKDVFYKEMAPSEFDQVLADLAAKRQDVVGIEPSSALKLVKGSVDFAAKSVSPRRRTIASSPGFSVTSTPTEVPTSSRSARTASLSSSKGRTTQRRGSVRSREVSTDIVAQRVGTTCSLPASPMAICSGRS